MKKILLLLSACLALNDTLWADPVGWGVRGGVDMANQPNDSAPAGTDVLFGFTGGFFVDVGLNDFLSFQPEADYVMKGQQYKFDNVLGTVTYSYNYLEMPLLLKAQAPLGRSTDLNIVLGPSPALLLNAIAQDPTLHTNNTLFYLAPIDIGLIFGGGVEIGRILLDLRFELGLEPINGGTGGPTNNVLSLTTGYRFQ